jgi:hypothetical protein
MGVDDDVGWGGANQRWGSGRAMQLMGAADETWRCFAVAIGSL